MLAPRNAAEIMDGVGVWWAIAGGWAIDLWLGERTREHHDVEVVIRRCDQPAIHEALRSNWELSCLDPPGTGWSVWGGRPIEPPAFQLQARSQQIEFDLFTESVTDGVWQYRRDDRIVRPVADITDMSNAGIPIVRPEIQLLYMARSNEPKNQHDFDVTRPTLSSDAAHWLAAALSVAEPGHRWLRTLRDG